MTHLRKAMLEELQRRNLSQITIRIYMRAVEDGSVGIRLVTDRQLTERAALSESLRDPSERPHAGTPGPVGHSLRMPRESPTSRSIGHFAQIPRWVGVNR